MGLSRALSVDCNLSLHINYFYTYIFINRDIMYSPRRSIVVLFSYCSPHRIVLLRNAHSYYTRKSSIRNPDNHLNPIRDIMERVKVSSLEPLLKLPGSLDPNALTPDASIVSCGCIVSETFFNSTIDSGVDACPECLTPNVRVLKPVRQLRELYSLITQLQGDTTTKSRRRSSSKRSFKTIDPNDKAGGEQMDLISLFYKYAKEEHAHPDVVSSVTPDVKPIQINKDESRSLVSNHGNSTSISPLRKVSPQGNSYGPDDGYHERSKSKTSKYEDYIWSTLSEEKEYNFSKCFPFHRKISAYQTQQGKLFSTNPFKSSVMKSSRFIGTDLNTFIYRVTGQEVTRFVMITEKRWELYELTNNTDFKPVLVCCGKLTGEYGSLFSNLREDYGHEVVIGNDFSGNAQANDPFSNEDHRKKLSQWEHLNCQLSNDFLVISGTKGIMRVFNISKASLPHEMGKPVYTYITNFPIRCIAISNTDPLLACGITAKERISGKEQPFVVLHKLVRSSVGDKIIGSVEPITITIPYRDPIKLLSFNANSTHLLCCTVWESRYLIIRLRGAGSDNFRKPRLIWTDSTIPKKRKKSDGVFYDDSDEEAPDDDALMMDNEGITDAKFGTIPNTLVLTSCSLQNRPPIMLRLEGSSMDSNGNRNISDSLSMDSSLHSRHEPDDEQEITNIKSSDLLLKFQEVGFSIHKVAILPRRDALAFLDKDGRIYLVSIPNYELNLYSSIKKIVVLLGEVSNAERYIEAATIMFSADGGKVYVVDRKGILMVYDFTKGIPGQDSDVTKCKIVNV